MKNREAVKQLIREYEVVNPTSIPLEVISRRAFASHFKEYGSTFFFIPLVKGVILPLKLIYLPGGLVWSHWAHGNPVLMEELGDVRFCSRLLLNKENFLVDRGCLEGAGGFHKSIDHEMDVLSCLNLGTGMVKTPFEGGHVLNAGRLSEIVSCGKVDTITAQVYEIIKPYMRPLPYE